MRRKFVVEDGTHYSRTIVPAYPGNVIVAPYYSGSSNECLIVASLITIAPTRS